MSILRLYRGSDLPPVVRRLGVASLFQDVASEMVYPLLPAFLAALGGGAAALGAMESAAEGVLAWVKGWAGRASDRAGRRKPFVVFGYAASALARPLLALARGAGQVVALRVWDRLAKGVRSAPRDAVLAGAVPQERRAYAFAFHRGLDHLGAAVGPLAAAALLAAGWELRWVFAAATLPAIVGVTIVALGIRDTEPRPVERRTDPVPARSTPALRSALPAALLFGLANSSDAFLLLRLTELGAPAATLSLVWAVMHVVRWVTAAPGGVVADRFGARRALAAGWTAYAALYAGFAATARLDLFLLLLLPYAAHGGLVEGAERALAVELGGADRAGASLGAWQRTAGYGALGASVIFGLVWEEFSAATAFAVGASAAALAVVALAAVRPPQR